MFKILSSENWCITGSVVYIFQGLIQCQVAKGMGKHNVPLYKTCQMMLYCFSYRLVINNVFVASHRKEYMDDINSM